MNFRQRIAWLLLSLYLIGTLTAAYYLFEFSDQYRSNALEHINKYHQHKDQGNFWQHLVDVPFSIWVLIFVIPYFQVFWVLLLCTKSEPVAHVRACLLPIVGWYFICGVRPSLEKTSANNLPRMYLSKSTTDGSHDYINEDTMVLLG